MNEMNEWIDRNERLPKSNIAALVANKRFVDIAYYSARFKKFIYYGIEFSEDDFDGWEVTHWMQLPKMPEVEK